MEGILCAWLDNQNGCFGNLWLLGLDPFSHCPLGFNFVVTGLLSECLWTENAVRLIVAAPPLGQVWKVVWRLSQTQWPWYHLPKGICNCQFIARIFNSDKNGATTKTHLVRCHLARRVCLVVHANRPWPWPECREAYWYYSWPRELHHGKPLGFAECEFPNFPHSPR